MTFFLIPRGTPDLSVGPPERKMGQHTSDTVQVHLEQCSVPDEAVLGEVGQGLPATMSGLSEGRISIAAQSVGMARAAYEYALAYAQERKTAGRYDCTNRSRAIRFMLPGLFDEGKDCVKEASIAKLFAGCLSASVRMPRWLWTSYRLPFRADRA